MRILILNVIYPDFLRTLYAQQPGLEQAAYDEQQQAIVDSLFGVADFYPRRLRELGHEAHEVFINNRYMQSAWMREHGQCAAVRSHLGGDRAFQPQRQLGPVRWSAGWYLQCLEAQIEYHRPDVILSHAIEEVPGAFWKRMRGQYRLLAGQVACAMGPRVDFGPFDVMLSSLPNYVEQFRAQGHRAEYFKLGFDPIVLERMQPGAPAYDVTFLGSLTSAHADRVRWIEQISRRADLKVWGPGVVSLPADSSIRRAYQGPAWGLDMYRILMRSKITLNNHIGIAGRFANNMRLYEATGAGTLLVTDMKDNLAELFQPGREVAAYRSTEECIEQIEYYLEHEDERKAVVQAGQARTLREHTYAVRMRELIDIVGRYL